MSYIIDIVIVVLFAVLVAHAYKKGFMSTVVDTFSVVIAAFVSHKFFEGIAEKAYDLLVRDLVETRFTRVLDDISTALPVSEKLSAMIDGLPQGAVKLAQAMGVNLSSLTNSMPTAGSLSQDDFIKLAVDKVGHTIMINVTEVVTFIVLFVILTFAIKFLAGLFKKVNDIPFLGKFNAILGGVIGLARALVVVYIACTAFYFIAGMSGATPVIEAVNSSFIYGFIIKNNPVISLVG